MRVPPPAVEKVLTHLADLIQRGRFRELETDTIEIKPVPPSQGQWEEHHNSACAFLNTRGGIIILGIKEEAIGPQRRYVFTGWQPHAEQNLKQLRSQFSDHLGNRTDRRTSRRQKIRLHRWRSIQEATYWRLPPYAMTAQYDVELRSRFGDRFTSLLALEKQLLSIIYRYTLFSKSKSITSKQASMVHWRQQMGNREDIKEFDLFSRRVR